MSVSSVLNESGRDLAQLAYVASPIIFQGGIADKMGGLAPIMLFTEAIDFLNGLVSGAISGSLNIPSLDTLWCHWKQAPSSGSAPNFLIQNTITTKPFANRSVASNGFNTSVSKISLQMICPARGPGAMATKLATMMCLQRVLEKHNLMGGRYILMTPSYIWTEMILTKVRDITSNHAKFPCSLYQFDFQHPITEKRDARLIGENLKQRYATKNGGMNIGATGGGNLAEKLLGGLGII